MDVIISAENIKKSFGSAEVLKGLTLRVDKGEIVAVMGMSGSGKTTLLHSLAAITTIDSGEVMFEGKSINKLSDNARSRLRRQKFGFVFQFSQLVPELTALDNIALPLLLNGASRRVAYEGARLWLEKVGMSMQADSLPSELSGGQMQRVAIARAMVAQPKVLFADEPTGALDSLNSKKVMELFIEMAKQHNTTVIMVTHEQGIADYADRTVYVRDGLIDEANL